MPKFYVTMTWDDWPEGGSYGTIVEAIDFAEAEHECRLEMAKTRLEDRQDWPEELDETDWAAAGCDADDWEDLSEIERDRLFARACATFARNYEGEWETVDCFELEPFIQQHCGPMRAAAADLLEVVKAVLRAPSDGSRGPGSSTRVIQDYHLRAAEAAVAKAEG